MTKEEMTKEYRGYRKSSRQMTNSLYHRQLEKIKLESMSTIDLVDILRERAKRIEELEKENGKLESKLADLQSEYIELENFKNNEINKLKAQIELMKCCQNCKHFDFDEPKYCHKGVYNCAYACGKWELGS